MNILLWVLTTGEKGYVYNIGFYTIGAGQTISLANNVPGYASNRREMLPGIISKVHQLKTV